MKDMILSATFNIGSDGLIRYDQDLSAQLTPMGEIAKLQLCALNNMHEAILKAVKDVNNNLKADGVAERLVELGQCPNYLESLSRTSA